MRYERTIAKALLLSILILMLLKMNFNIWGVTYYEGDLENQVRQEMQLIEECGKPDSTCYELVERISALFSGDTLFICGILFVFCSFGLLIFIRQPIKIFYSNTLVALSVRLND